MPVRRSRLGDLHQVRMLWVAESQGGRLIFGNHVDATALVDALLIGSPPRALGYGDHARHHARSDFHRHHDGAAIVEDPGLVAAAESAFGGIRSADPYLLLPGFFHPG